MPQPRRMRDASGLGIRSTGDLEPSLFDLDDQIAGEAGLDAERAPWTHCQGSATTFSSSHWQAASLSGRIEMIEP
jgi:hypothetical protein